MEQCHKLVNIYYWQKGIGIPKVIVFINKVDEIPEEDAIIIDIIEEEMRKLCEQYEYKDVTVIRGSAKTYLDNGNPEIGEKSIAKLVSCLELIPLSPKEHDKPLLFTVESVYQIPGRGTVAAGKIIRGFIDLVKDKDKKVAILCPGDKKDKITVITSMEAFKVNQTYAGPHDDIGLLLRGLKSDDITRGCVICEVGSIAKSSRFICSFYLVKKEEGGRKTPIREKYQPQFFIRTADVTGTIEKIKSDQEFISPGDVTDGVEVQLRSAIPLEEFLRFVVREGGKTIAAGVITKVL